MMDGRVLVIGDVMVDHFIVGRVSRMSPEAPVPVVAFDRDEYRAGGAANVALNLRRGKQGIWLAGETVESHLPAATREVADVTGADETVAATLALARTADATIAEATQLRMKRPSTPSDPSAASTRSVSEVAPPRKHHRQAVFIRGGDHL